MNAPSRIISPSDIGYARSGLLTSSNLPSLIKWKAARARVRAGTGRGRLLLCGTSETQGYAALDSASAVGCWPLSYPTRLAAELSARGVPTSLHNIFGDTNCGGLGIAYSAYDARTTQGANWVADTTHPIIGGHWFSYNNGAPNNFTFTPTGQIDTAIPYWWKAQAGSFSFNVDGGSSLGTSAGVAAAWGSMTGTFTKGNHTINIVPTNNGTVFLGGIIAYDSTAPAIDVIQAGFNGATAAAYVGTGQGYNAPGTFAAVGADLTVIALDANDVDTTTVGSWSASMQTLITAAQAVGDVLLVKEPPGPTTPLANQQAYQAAYQQLTIANPGVLFLDLCSRWGTYALANAAMPYGSGRHPDQVGYADWAIAIADMLTI